MSSWFWQNRSFKAVAVIRRLSNRRSDLYQIIWPKPNHLGWVNPDMFIWMSHEIENASSNENRILKGRAVILKTLEYHDLNSLKIPAWNRKSSGHSCGHSYQHFIHWWNNLVIFDHILPLLTDGAKIVVLDKCEASHLPYGAYNGIWQNPFERGECHVALYAFVLMIWHFWICQIIETTNQNDPRDILLARRFEDFKNFEPKSVRWSMSIISLTFEKVYIGITVPVNEHINAVIELNHSIVIFCHFVRSQWRRVLVVNSPISLICFK